MKKVLMFTLTALVAVMLSANAFAFGPEKGGRREGYDPGKMHDKMVETLGLTAEQQEALKKNREETRARMSEIRTEMTESRKTLYEELKKPEIDRGAVDRAVGGMKDAQGKLIDQKVEGFLEMKKVLTPEQFDKLIDMRQDRGEGNKARMRERFRETREKRRDTR